MIKFVLKKIRELVVKLITLFFPLLKLLRAKFMISEELTRSLSDYKIDSEGKRIINHLISKKKLNKKISILDVGAQGDFFLEDTFSHLNFKNYRDILDIILVEPNKKEAKILKNKNYKVIENGLWSKKCNKKLYVTGLNPGASSFFLPDRDGIKIYCNDQRYIDLYKITEKQNIKCDTTSKLLAKLKIRELDYLKIDTQGSELEILKGLNNYFPLMIKVELQIFPMYKNAPDWSKVLHYLYKKNYSICAFNKAGSHLTHAPAQADALFIPNFLTQKGRKEILKRRNIFIFLMIVFGQIQILKHISNELKFKNLIEINNLRDKYFE